MTDLTQTRIIILALGVLGCPLALMLIGVSFQTMRQANRRAIRYTSGLFFIFALGVLSLLTGQACISGWLLYTNAEQSLLPGVVQIATMILFDLALLGMLLVNRFMIHEKPQKRS